MAPPQFDDPESLRRAAIRLFDRGLSILEIATALGVEATVVFRWRNNYDAQIGHESGRSSVERSVETQALERIKALEQQLEEAQREVAQLQAQLALALQANDALRAWLETE